MFTFIKKVIKNILGSKSEENNLPIISEEEKIEKAWFDQVTIFEEDYIKGDYNLPSIFSDSMNNRFAARFILENKLNFDKLNPAQKEKFKPFNTPLTRDEKWWVNYLDFEKFFKEYNRIPSKNQNTSEREKHLAKWAERQKENKNKNKLSEAKINLLQYYPDWKWQDNKSERWDINFSKLEEFVKNNDKYPSRRANDKNEKNLAEWVADQKKYHQKGKLPNFKQDKLNSLSNWKWRQTKG